MQYMDPGQYSIMCVLFDFHQNSPFEASINSSRTEFRCTFFLCSSLLFKLGCSNFIFPAFVMYTCKGFQQFPTFQCVLQVVSKSL